MESIGCKGERVDEEAADELEKEEKGVDDYHNLDAQALGPADAKETGHGDGGEGRRRTALVESLCGGSRYQERYEKRRLARGVEVRSRSIGSAGEKLQKRRRRRMGHAKEEEEEGRLLMALTKGREE